MKITVIDDYQDAFRQMSCFSKLAGHEVEIYNDTLKDPAQLAGRLQRCRVRRVDAAALLDTPSVA